MADFLQKLILFEEAQGNQNSVGEAAEALERETLAGQIKATRSQVAGYPEFAYRPSGMGEDIRLHGHHRGVRTRSRSAVFEGRRFARSSSRNLKHIAILLQTQNLLWEASF